MAADLRAGVGQLLARAQHSGGIRGDVRLADLMALITGVLLAIQARPGDSADPQVAVAVLGDGCGPCRAEAPGRGPGPGLAGRGPGYGSGVTGMRRTLASRPRGYPAAPGCRAAGGAGRWASRD